MSRKSIQILAYHGWGFDKSLWYPLQKEFEDYVIFNLADRGYFSGPVEPSWKRDPGIKKVLLVHSYGLHWCSNKILEQADHLVMIGSFLNFHPEEKNEYKRSKLLVRKMITQLVEAPEMVLENFYENAFYPDEQKLEVPQASNLNHDLLLSDLSDLDRDQRKNARVFDLNSITIIHGAKDQIVSNDMARNMYKKLRLRSQYFEIKNGGHVLPLTHSSKIFEILKSLLQLEQENI
ncbi:MAG: alpha/beta hydrolase [Balneolaceae bacterium]|nr:alpha/beta hydrolase [Balneolaceae bacterium]